MTYVVCRHDSEKLQDVFIAHYVELEALRQTVSGNPTVEKEWYVGKCTSSSSHAVQVAILALRFGTGLR